MAESQWFWPRITRGLVLCGAAQEDRNVPNVLYRRTLPFLLSCLETRTRTLIVLTGPEYPDPAPGNSKKGKKERNLSQIMVFEGLAKTKRKLTFCNRVFAQNCVLISFFAFIMTPNDR